MEFRISVCLTRVYSDERSYCYIYLDKSYENISSIERYLRRLFRLKGEFCLMINNYLLPSDQPTKIIGVTDTLTVVPLKKNWSFEAEIVEADAVESERNIEENAAIEVIDAAEEKTSKKKKKKKSKTETIEPSVLTEEDILIVRKNEAVTSEYSPSNDSLRQEKKDSDMDVSMGSDADREEDPAPAPVVENDDDESDMEEPRVTDVQSAIQQLKLKALSLLSEASVQRPAAGVSGGRINKRKRIRKRNNKNSSLSMSTPDLTDSPATVPLSFKPLNKSASHIRFDNDRPVIIQNSLPHSEGSIKPRIIHAVENSSASNSRRTSVCGNNPDDSVSNCDTNVQSQAVPTVNGNSKVNVNEKKTSVTCDSIKKRLLDFPVMDNVYPVSKDLILFKMFKMGTDYLPGISDFILANVIEVDKDKDLVKLSVLDGKSECLPPSGKFDLEPLPETPLDEDLVLDIPWSQVVDPRLVFP